MYGIFKGGLIMSLDGVKTNNYMGSVIFGKPTLQGSTTSAFSGRKEETMETALSANSIHVAANQAQNK